MYSLVSCRVLTLRSSDLILGSSALFSLGAGEGDDRIELTNEDSGISLSGVTLRDLARLIRGTGASARIVMDDDELEEAEVNEHDWEEDDSDDDAAFRYVPETGSVNGKWFPTTTDAQEKGLELLSSGDFGLVGAQNRRQKQDINVPRRVFNRKVEVIPTFHREDLRSVSAPIV